MREVLDRYFSDLQRAVAETLGRKDLPPLGDGLSGIWNLSPADWLTTASAEGA